MFRRILISILLTCLSLSGQTVLAAQPDYRHRDGHRDGHGDRHAVDAAASNRAALRLAQSKVSLDQAVAKVLRTFGGKLIKAETRGNVHYVKVLMDNGRVRTVRVDGNSGRIL